MVSSAKWSCEMELGEWGRGPEEQHCCDEIDVVWWIEVKIGMVVLEQ